MTRNCGWGQKVFLCGDTKYTSKGLLITNKGRPVEKVTTGTKKETPKKYHFRDWIKFFFIL